MSLPGAVPDADWHKRRGQDVRVRDEVSALWADPFATWEDAEYSWTGESERSRMVWGPTHSFIRSSDLVVSNGLIRLTVGPTDDIPYVDVDAVHEAEWKGYGRVAFAHPDATPRTKRADLVWVTPDAVTVSIDTTELGPIFVTVKRGERMIRVQHGASVPAIDTARSIYWLSADGVHPTVAGGSPGGIYGATHEGYTRALAALKSRLSLPPGPSLGLRVQGVTVAFAAYLASGSANDTVDEVHRQFAAASAQQLGVR